MKEVENNFLRWKKDNSSWCKRGAVVQRKESMRNFPATVVNGVFQTPRRPTFPRIAAKKRAASRGDPNWKLLHSPDRRSTRGATARLAPICSCRWSASGSSRTWARRRCSSRGGNRVCPGTRGSLRRRTSRCTSRRRSGPGARSCSRRSRIAAKCEKQLKLNRIKRYFTTQVTILHHIGWRAWVHQQILSGKSISCTTAHLQSYNFIQMGCWQRSFHGKYFSVWRGFDRGMSNREFCARV